MRFLFILVALGGMWGAVSGIWLNIQTHGVPTVVSVNDIASHPGMHLPKLVEIKDSDFSETLCIYPPGSNRAPGAKQTCDDMLIPVLTPSQEASAAAGKDVTAAVIAKASKEMVDKFNADNDTLTQNSLGGVNTLKGVIGGDIFDHISNGPGILKASHVLIDDNTVLLDMKNLPDSTGSDIGLFVFSAAIGAAAIFLRRKKKVEEEV